MPVGRHHHYGENARPLEAEAVFLESFSLQENGLSFQRPHPFSLNGDADMVLPVAVTSPESVVVGKAGSSVVLPCQYSTTVGTDFVLEWRFAPPSTIPVKGQQIFYYTKGASYKLGSQSERLSISQSPPTSGAGSLQISNLQSSDSGTYVCEVNNPPDFAGTGSTVINLTVLVPPSSPSCQVNGNAIVGSEATLTCTSATGTPLPIYSWSLLGSKTPLLRGMLEDQRSGRLLLTNISQAFSGTYQCISSNELGQATCQVTLAVTTSSKAGMIAGIVIGVLLALILIAIVIVCLLCYRKKKQNDKRPYHGSEIREDAVAPSIQHGSRRSDRSGSSLLTQAAGRRGHSSTVNSRLHAEV
ncbi:V-set and immunoglobulin domain-containing protein 2 [Ambystoma mexicanum]|uniref:V-set and immunoglobulin domain-containing protein 2 n=1 Tax=Ambystoma mexicanum TaxID=8296 RepID=UPI0037E79C60